MGGCLSTCPDNPSVQSTVPEEVNSATREPVPVEVLPLDKGRHLRKTALESLLLASTNSWREKLNALVGKNHLLVSLFIYSSDCSHAVAVHSAGTAAHLVPPGLVCAASHGSSHALLLEPKKPLIHTHAAPLEPLPPDWCSLGSSQSVDSFLLLPLLRPGQLYGSVLMCLHEMDSGSCSSICDDARHTVQSVYDTEELDILSQYLSVGLLTSATDLEVLQMAANAATLIQRSVTIQDSVASLVEAVQACLRLSTRVDLECLPAVAFRSCQVAAFFRNMSVHSHMPSNNTLQLQKQALMHQSTQHALGCGAAGGLHVQPRTFGGAKWLMDDSSALGTEGGSSSLIVPAASLCSGAAHGLRSLERDALHQQQQGQQRQQHPQQPMPNRPFNLASQTASSNGGGCGGMRAGFMAQSVRESSDPITQAGGSQTPRGHLSMQLTTPVAPGAKVKASTTRLNQTLFAQHLDLLPPVTPGAAAARASYNGNCSSINAITPVDQAAFPGGSREDRLLSNAPEAAAAAAAVLAASLVEKGGSDSGAGSQAIPGGVYRRPLGVAIVPNCATFLMADERLPYKDVLHVQRMMPQARVHSLVMVVGGSLEQPQTAYDSSASNMRQLQDGSGDGDSTAAANGGDASIVLKQQLLGQGNVVVSQCGGKLQTDGSMAPKQPHSLSAAESTAIEAAGTADVMKHCCELGVSGQMSIAVNRAAAATPTAGGSLVDILEGAPPPRLSGSAPYPPASLALYLVSPESVPRVILEQVAEEARQLLQVLQRPLGCALNGPYLSTEWSRFTSLVLAKATGGGDAASTLSGNGIRGSSMMASGPHYLSHLAPRAMEASTQTQLSMDTTDDATILSIALDGAVNANTGTLSMMISSMRDVLSTVQLERSPDFRPASLEDIYSVRLIKVIGRGGQGMVFQGQLYNTLVAVKIIPSSDDPDVAAAAAAHPHLSAAAAAAATAAAGGDVGAMNAERQEALLKLHQRQKRWLVRDALEVAVTSTMSHHHIVQVLNFFTDTLVVEYSNDHGKFRLLPREDSPNAKGASNTAIVMEYCDAGTLKHAIDNSCFRIQRNVQPRPPDDITPTAASAAKAAEAATVTVPSSSLLPSTTTCINMVALLTSLVEVAAGLRHLHEHRLVHCDIKPSNVLLRSCAADARGWMCKLSDFGCVRLMSEVDPSTGRPAFHSLSPVGSLSYMAPEGMFRDTYLDSSIDIYSFGIMMWECAMGHLPYAGVSPQQLPSLVRRGLRPSFHPSVSQEYRQIACTCWAQDPRRRPSAAVLVRLLQRMLSHASAEADAHEALMQNRQQQQQHNASQMPLVMGSPYFRKQPAAAAAAAAAATAADHQHSSLPYHYQQQQQQQQQHSSPLVDLPKRRSTASPADSANLASNRAAAFANGGPAAAAAVATAACRDSSNGGGRRSVFGAGTSSALAWEASEGLQ